MVDALLVRVPGHPDSPNRLDHRHWSVRHRHSARWRGLARLCAADALSALPGRRDALGLPWGRVRITLVWTYPARRFRDPDNELASAKPVIDGLIDAGLIAGDTARHVEYGAPERLVVRGARELAVRVERLPGLGEAGGGGPLAPRGWG